MSDSQGFSEESLRRIAEQKINYRRSVKIHWTAFLLVNILLFIINVLTAGFILEGLWSIYPLLGWFIGVAMHTVSYSLYAKGVYPMGKRGVIYHLTGYLTVMLLLLVINILTLPNFYWVIFPAIFWGVGLIAHMIVYNIYFKEKLTDTGDVKSKKEKAIEKEMEKMRRRMNQQNK